MTQAPVGHVGKFVANRPVLSISVFSIGLTALAVVGSRNAGGDGTLLASTFIMNALIAVAFPMALVAVEPRGSIARSIFFVLIVIGAGIFSAASLQVIPGLSGILAPPLWLTMTSMGLMIYFFAMSPMLTNIVKLGALAPFAAVLGVAGAAGHLAVEAMLMLPEGAAAASIALTVGASIGAGVSADFSRFFARGFSKKRAAAAAGHAGIAPLVFSLMAVTALFLVLTVNSNFGAVEWRIVWAGLTAVMAASVASLLAVTGALALEKASEQIAVDENRRRQWFVTAWRPLRRILPMTSAVAITAIAIVLAIIALFETGFATPVSMLVFIALIAVASAICFVSVRTSLLIVILMGLSTIAAGYIYAIVGLPMPELQERLVAMTICAVGLGHLTVSWRDAGDLFHGARDIAENALSDGLRRFLFLVGVGGASLFVASQTFAWQAGAAAAQYFLVISLFSLILAVPVMITMSARFNNY